MASFAQMLSLFMLLTDMEIIKPLPPQESFDRAIHEVDVTPRSENLKRVCYFRMDPSTGIRLSHVDGALCTHINLAFGRLDAEGNLVMGRPEDLPYLLEVPELKRLYPHLKVLISLYNEKEEFDGFTRAARRLENRQRFASSAMEFLERYQLDGVDLDWEFPNFPNFLCDRPKERSGQTEIVRELRQAINLNYRRRSEEAASSSGQTNEQVVPLVEPYLLTMAVAAQRNIMEASYELSELAHLCDWLNIMSYDYFLYKPYLPFTGHNSPLLPMTQGLDVPPFSNLSHSATIAYLVERIPLDKIVMGIPTYARAYRLLFKNKRPRLLALATSEVGGRIPDYMDFREVSELLRRPDTVVEFDDGAKVPHLLTEGGSLWVSYENEESARLKVRYLLSKRLGGYMTWNLNSDDFEGFSYPLHRAMYEETLRAK